MLQAHALDHGLKCETRPWLQDRYEPALAPNFVVWLLEYVKYEQTRPESGKFIHEFVQMVVLQ